MDEQYYHNLFLKAKHTINQWKENFVTGKDHVLTKEQSRQHELCWQIIDGQPGVKIEDFHYDQDPDNEESFMENVAFSYLVDQEVVFVNWRPYIENPWTEGEEKNICERDTIVAFANCNDVFMWGCADAYEIENIKSLRELVKEHIRYGFSGTCRWICRRRNNQPQKAVIAIMKKAGAWDEEMEALPENSYDAWCRKKAEERKKKEQEEKKDDT